jgi:outer membrane biosynthesis protein TonB
MALSRPFVLAILGALLAVATFASVRSASDSAEADDTAAAPTVVQPAPSTKKPAKTSTTPTTPTDTTPAPKAKAKPKAKPKPKPAPAVKGVPPKVGKALAAKRTVVVFFRQPAADDDATARAVRSLKGMKGVSVFSAPITKVGRYERLISGLGVTQAPAVVIVGKSRKGRLIEGYVDSGSLRQQVKDAR